MCYQVWQLSWPGDFIEQQDFRGVDDWENIDDDNTVNNDDNDDHDGGGGGSDYNIYLDDGDDDDGDGDDDDNVDDDGDDDDGDGDADDDVWLMMLMVLDGDDDNVDDDGDGGADDDVWLMMLMVLDGGDDDDNDECGDNDYNNIPCNSTEHSSDVGNLSGYKCVSEKNSPFKLVQLSLDYRPKPILYNLQVFKFSYIIPAFIKLG